MEAFSSWVSGIHESGGFLLNSDVIGDGFGSSPCLVLDREVGEIMEASIRVERKGASSERTIAALKNHSEAERRRRARINAHLDALRSVIPGAKKMDKASLLGEVIRQLKELKGNAVRACEGFVVPNETDEIRIEEQEDGLEGVPYSIMASLCCEYKPGILSDIRQALDSLPLMIVRAEISTMGTRMKNVLVITSSKEQKVDDGEARQLLATSVHRALKSVLDRFSASPEFSSETRLPSKRRRISIFSSAS